MKEYSEDPLWTLTIFLHKKTGEIAEYDPIMGMYYVKGRHHSNGPMVPFTREELEESEEWTQNF
jgi:hypothetical protein